MDRLAQGIYFLTVLLHKFKNGNGRTARALKKMVEKMPTDEDITIEEVQGIVVSPSGDQGSVDFPVGAVADLERLTKGVIQFGQERGVVYGDDEYEPKGQKGLMKHAEKLAVDYDQLKAEFIKYMAVDIDYSASSSNGTRRSNLG